MWAIIAIFIHTVDACFSRFVLKLMVIKFRKLRANSPRYLPSHPGTRTFQILLTRP